MNWQIESLAYLGSVVMVVIWFVYLQIIYLDFRRRNRPFLIIHHAQGNDPAALCMLVNMSKEPVDIQCVVANIYGPEENSITRYVTTYSQLNLDNQNVQSSLREGPIQPGGYIVLGTFEEIILGETESEEQKSEEKSNRQCNIDRVKEIELGVAVNHGPSKSIIGARRRFFVEREGNKVVIRAYSIHTEQLTTRRKRKIVSRWVEKRLQPKHSGTSQNRETDQGKDDESD